MSSFSDYRGSKKYVPPNRSRASERPGRMKRLNARLRDDPEFAKEYAAQRAARTQIINAKPLRRSADDLNSTSPPSVRKPSVFDDASAISGALKLAHALAGDQESHKVTLAKADEALTRIKLRLRC